MKIQVAAFAAILSSTLLLAGCANNPPIVTPIPKPPIVVPPVDQVKMRDVKWIVVTPDNVNQVFADLKKQGQTTVLYALPTVGYQNITLNLADLLKLTRQQSVVIGAYEKYNGASSKPNK